MLLLGIGLLWEGEPSQKGNSRIGVFFNILLGISNHPMESKLPHWYQLFIAFVGSTFLTQYVGSTLSNLLANRAASHRKGFLRYWFSDHILILGGSKVAVGILKSIAVDAELRKKEVVILTNQDAEELWVHIIQLLTDEERMVKLMIYHGERNMDKELENSQVDLASVIYIIGEDDEMEHDSINVDCWKRVREYRKCASDMAQCYLLLERNASTYVFYSLPGDDIQTMETTIVNELESVAQQVLIGDDKKWMYYTLDRGKIIENSDKSVHLVIVGLTQMGFAMATTAEHLCHYPNFDKNENHRTKITFIDPDAENEMKMFKSRYPGLFELSHSSYRWGSGENDKISFSPSEEYGDFLDVEWEFVKGSIIDDWVQELIKQWKRDENKILALAFCGENAEKNMAEALYLPKDFFLHVDDTNPLTDRNPLVWVYQPDNSALVDTAHEQVGRYKNLLSFGTMTGSFDSRMGKRLAAAKRINYLYHKQNMKEVYGTMANQDELDRLWHGLSYAEKMSNIYAANSIYCKFRSMGIKEGESVPESAVESLAQMEHARWNIEKLLVGFSALPKKERGDINMVINGDDMTVKETIKTMYIKKKKEKFEHKDIAPYKELPKESQEYDRALVRNLADVIKGLL